jgi:uncharacterized protein YkwD
MNRNGKSFDRRRFPPQVEVLDARQLPSGGLVTGLVAVPTGRFLAAKAPTQDAKLALEASARHSTPELRQAFAFRRARTAQPVMRIGRLVVTAQPGPLLPSDTGFIALAVPRNAAVVTQAVIDLTNHVRCENNLEPLVQNPGLMEAAAIHSQDMARTNQMLHDIEGARLPTLIDRAAYSHYSYRMLGENIAFNQADAASVVAGWMSSAPHRENMLNPAFSEIGVGVAWNRRREPYYTMMLGQPA